MSRQIALLRGINLGPARRIAMAELRAHLEREGHAGVRTHMQSGNVLLRSDLEPETLERLLERQIAAGFGMDVPVIVRTRDALASVVARDPLGDVADDPRRYQVSFLSGPPDPESVRALEARDFGPERVVFDGREAYAWHPDGIQRSPLAQALGAARLGVTATARNWSTVTKLLALADE